MASSISITKNEFQLLRQVYASTILEDEHVGYFYKNRIISNSLNGSVQGTDSYGSVTGPIKSKGMILSILRSDYQGGIITGAEYRALEADIRSSLSL
jgi:hypothetical protein